MAQTRTLAAFDYGTAGQEAYFTTAPYEWLYQFREDPFTHSRHLELMAIAGRKVGVRNVKTLYKHYVDQVRSASAKIIGQSTNFNDQPIELQTGPWQADESGIFREGEFQTVYACTHPVLPIERLINIDTGMEKLKLAYRPGRVWRTHIADKSTLASSQQIIGLADYGVSVSSETSKNLVKYIQDLEQLNYEAIPESRSISRLGWVGDGEFSPYVPDIVFDGEVNFKAIYDAIVSAGDYESWCSHISAIRRSTLTARIVMAASFASVLVEPCGCLPFFVHLWGAESGTGKTVALMAAASVWASPVIGGFLQTFNSTVVSRERVAGFLNSLPMIIDELQLSKDIRGVQRFDPYQLAEGTGRGRGTKYGGIDRTITWANCMITTGETPLVGTQDGAGAINRVLDIEVMEGEQIIADGHATANFVRLNHGHAGRKFVERLNNGGTDEARALYQKFYRQLTEGDTTEKQAMAAALLVTADHLATEWIFQDDANLTVDEISQYLATRKEVSSTERGYEWLCDWVAVNAARFSSDQMGETYGVIEAGRAYIITSVFNNACDEGGFSARAMLSWMSKRGIIEQSQGKNSITKRIAGTVVRCVSMQLPDDLHNEQVFDL